VPLPRMRARLSLALAAVLWIGCAPARPWTGGPLPARITPEFVLVNYPNCIDGCSDPRTELWVRIRDRPDLLRALIQIAESPATDEWTRSNAVLRIGSTGQEEGYRYLVRLLRVLPRGSSLRTSAIVSLGAGNRPLPDLVYTTLETLLHAPFEEDARLAVSTLAGIGTARAREILERRLEVPADDPYLHGIIRGQLQHWRPDLAREPVPVP
jgi:hypothetical protein